jgi:hypothetical protein
MRRNGWVMMSWLVLSSALGCSGQTTGAERSADEPPSADAGSDGPNEVSEDRASPPDVRNEPLEEACSFGTWDIPSESMARQICSQLDACTVCPQTVTANGEVSAWVALEGRDCECQPERD